MKKILLFLILFLISFNVKALGTVRQEKIEGVYANQIVKGKSYWAPLTYIYINENIAYCIEPGVYLGSSSYLENDNFDEFNISDATKKKLELIAYYGYNYPNHQNKYYYMATQELIWREITSDDVYFTTQSNYKGDIIDVSFYKEEIKKLIDNHNLKPSFDNIILEKKKDEVITLNDQNKVIDNFKIESGNAFIKDNSITIKGLDEINLTRNYSGTSIIYTSPGSQRLITLDLNDKIVSRIYLIEKIENYQLKIIKKDNQSLNIIGEATFKIKKLSNDTYIKINNSELLTTTNGILNIDQLEEGYYLIEEIEAPIGYLINDEKIKVYVSEKKQEIEVLNKKIEMPKTGYKASSSSIYLSIMLALTLKKYKNVF